MGADDKCRVLALLGSGETSPTMVGLHRSLVARLGSATPRAVLLETPYGFQENAADISARAQAYFATSVGLDVSVAPGLRTQPSGQDGVDGLAAVRSADWVFSGPGSPTYALSHWRDGPVGRALRDRVVSGLGATVLASAAAATAGLAALPVYEIYKVGDTPHWLEGLDLLNGLDLPVAVIPHYDNAEGGTHDTRYCYLGERRLSPLEHDLPKDAAVLGIDEHTAAVIDLVSGTVDVHGRGGLTVRRRGNSTVLPTGTCLRLADLRALVRGESRRGGAVAPASTPSAGSAAAPEPASLTLTEITLTAERRFQEAQQARDAAGMVSAILDVEAAIRAWASDTEEDQGTAQASEVLRTLIVRLGDAAVAGLRDPTEVIGPVVDPLIALRHSLRQRREFAVADELRAALTGAGVELHDTDDGTRWSLPAADPSSVRAHIAQSGVAH